MRHLCGSERTTFWLRKRFASIRGGGPLAGNHGFPKSRRCVEGKTTLIAGVVRRVLFYSQHWQAEPPLKRSTKQLIAKLLCAAHCRFGMIAMPTKHAACHHCLQLFWRDIMFITRIAGSLRKPLNGCSYCST